MTNLQPLPQMGLTGNDGVVLRALCSLRRAQVSSKQTLIERYNQPKKMAAEGCRCRLLNEF